MSPSHLRSILLLIFPGILAGQGPQGPTLRVDTVASGFTQPTAMVFLPEGGALVSDRRAGTISLVDLATGRVTVVVGAPANLHVEDAGIHDLALHPDFARNRALYVSYSLGDSLRSTLAIDRARLEGGRLVDRRRIFTADAWSDEAFHYGGRMAFRDSLLFVTVGDRHRRVRAQSLGSHAGKILRLRDDGRPAPGNPFAGLDTARAEIWSFGHRNPQGLALDPTTGLLWANEHGPRHGDELNLIEAGRDYGWPRVSWGWEYEGGPIGQGIPVDERSVMPTWVWTPAIAPSGLLIYRGAAFPEWRGNLLSGSMSRRRNLNRLVLRGRTVVLEERLFPGELGRMRFVTEDPSGHLYLGTDDGLILRIRPTP